MKRSLMLLVAVLAALALLVVPLAPAQAAAYNGYEGSTHQNTNKQRVKHDLRKLDKSACLQRFAQRQAERMAKERQLFHQELGPVAKACGLDYAGENVAYGYPSGHAVVRGWMGSSGHRANILRPQFKIMGIGAVKKRGTWWVAQVFGRKA